jgi:hypothetical protein
MSETNETVENVETSEPVKVDGRKGRAGRKSKAAALVNTINWEEKEAQWFTNGRTQLSIVAADLGVSLPTARVVLSLKYGTRLVFGRGRKGGTQLLSETPE